MKIKFTRELLVYNSCTRFYRQ